MTKASTDCVDWTIAMLSEYRKAAKSMSTAQIGRLRKGLAYFLPPCEIAWITTANPWAQIVITCHQPGLGRDKIYSFGPFDFEGLPQEIEAVLQCMPFSRALQATESEHYYADRQAGLSLREVVEHHLIQLVNDPPSAAAASKYHRKNPLRGSSMRLTTTGFIWRVLGDLSTLDPREFARRLLDGFRSETPRASDSTKPVETVVDGFCCFLYPQSWIEPASSVHVFADKTRFGLHQRAERVVVDSTYRGQVIFVKTGGLIAVHSTNRAEAIRLLNQIMLGLVLGGHSAHVLHEAEVGEVKLNLTTRNTGMMQLPMVTPRQDQILFLPNRGFVDPRNWQQVSVTQMLEAIALGECVSDSMPKQWVLWFLQGHTNIENLEYDQAFLSLWNVVEQHVSSRWQKNIALLTKKRRNKFNHPEYWSVDRSLEILSLQGLIAGADYASLMDFKRVRNGIMHDLRSVERAQAEALLKYVATMLHARP